MTLLLTPSFVVTVGVTAAVVYLAVIAALGVVAAIRAGGRREEATTDHEALSVSRFTIPVSVIVPVSHESQGLTSAIPALLALNYPEFEVIVVADGAPPQTIDALLRDWDLEAKEFFYRRSIGTADVHRIYRSARDNRLMVIDKAAGGYSDAMNCGMNVARYRYVLSVAPDVTVDADALLRAMAAPMRNPAHIVGASSLVERGARPIGDACLPTHGETGLFAATYRATFQRLASVRSLMASRLAWRQLRSGFGPSGAVFVWRRDALLKAQGFSPGAADADLEMMFRLQAAPDGLAGFDVGSDIVGRGGVRPMASVMRTTARRQVATLQILWRCLGGGGRGVETRALAYFIESEMVTPIAQLAIAAGTCAGAIFGTLPWSTFVLAIVGLSFGNAAVTAAALLLRGAAPNAPRGSELRQLLIAAPLEFVCHRPAVAASRLAGVVMFLLTSSTTRRTRRNEA